MERPSRKRRRIIIEDEEEEEEEEEIDNRPSLVDVLPSELLLDIKKRLDPPSSRLFRSTCKALMALTEPSDAEWDQLKGPMMCSLRRGAARAGISVARLSDAQRPRHAKRTWPPVRSAGRKTPVDEPTLKRYALNAALMRHLSLLGFPVTDNHGRRWFDDGDGDEPGPVEDKRRFAYLHLPRPGSGDNGNVECALSFQFETGRGYYMRALFEQAKGSNAHGIDACFEHAQQMFQLAAAPATLLMKPSRWGGPCPRMDERGTVRLVTVTDGGDGW
jgi:hypothetical protein